MDQCHIFHYFVFCVPLQEWNKELEDLFRVLSGESEDRTDDLFEIAVEKITALYGADADRKTLEELKNDDKFAEIERFINKERCFSTSSVSFRRLFLTYYMYRIMPS